MAESIQERRKIKDYLTGLLEVFKLYTSEAEILQEENNIRLALLISLLEGGWNNQQEPSLSDLVELFGKASSEESIETLRERLVDHSSLPYQTKLTLATTDVGEMEERSNKVAYCSWAV